MEVGQDIYLNLKNHPFTILGFSTDRNTTKIAILQSKEDNRIILFIPVSKISFTTPLEIDLEEYPEVYSMID
ncbi:hypothetical protein [Zhaonella formicivorans]|uniref:hypothetical protein n=1 Tax=Zhaonella formicivorans TaxID=2528593 RepID=UPI0010F2B891|nr:hypothetical protein [Zhaonella formicivorans]